MDAVSMKSSDQRTRRSANFTPSLWKEYLLRLERQVSTYDFKKEEFCEQEREHERLKEVVRMMLTEPGVGSGPQTLDLIDIIERLGLFYHFECEIQALMLTSKLEHGDEYDDHDLHKVALRFRLLRQLGHYVSCDVFNKFKDQEGNFKESLVTDVRGLLGLFEAAHYRVHEEDILGEALNFTTSQLVSMLPNLDHFWTPRVKQALEVPIQKTLNRIGARRFISLYEEDTSHNAVLLKFAKLDFNILQRLHQKELLNEAKWWNSLNAAENFPFARDRLVECSFWTLGVYFEPKYSEARQSLAKVIAMVSIVDDIYDSYGFLDELLLFMDSIERWHISALDQLPSYMGQCYRALLNVYNEIEERLAKEGKSDLINYAISSKKNLARSYLEEAKWIYRKEVPNFEEYMKVALVSATYEHLSTASLVCMGEFVAEDALKWIVKVPSIVRASSVICRLMDDMADYEWGKERGELASAVECYMKQYSASKEETFAEFEKRLANAWKDINAESVNQNSAVSRFILERVINYSSIMYLLFRGNDGYTNPSTETKDMIKSVLFDPVLM